MQNRLIKGRVKIQHIPVAKILVGKYQKRLNKKRVEAIVKNFDHDRMRPIEVSLRDGKYWCWDGQHRLAAYIAMGFDFIECQVHEGLSYFDDARLFAAQQDNVGTITTAHKFNALYEAGDKRALSIVKKCGEYGFSVHPTKSGGKNIRSIKTLQDIEQKLGINRLGDIVWLMKSAWDHSPESTHDNIVGGLGVFLQKYLSIEASAKEYEANAVVINRLHEQLSKTTAREVLQLSHNYQGGNGHKRAALAIVQIYNKGLAGVSRKRLPRFDLSA